MGVRAALFLACFAALLVPAAAFGADGAEQQLAEKYAPVVGLKQHEPCADTGEAYRPVPVETVLGLPDVVLLGPDGTVVKKAPTAADLYGKGEEYWLDFPGDPLDAGCSYEEWFNRIAAGKPTTAYAHIVEEQGQLALQYWFYYPFNDWNNKHESDWEMIQLVFDAPTAEAGARPDACARRLLAARGSRERDLGRRQARETQRSPGRVPGRRLARQPVRPIVVSRAQRADRVWL